MNLENIAIGLEVKNYKEMCKLLDEEVKSSNSKKAQLKRWKSYFDYTNIGQRFIVTDIYDIPKEKPRANQNRFGRGNHNWIEFENLNIKYEERDNCGVYKIVKDNEIYIGSTVVGFRERFKQHRLGSKQMEHTKELIDRGGIFSIIVDMTGVEDIELVRMVEDCFIRYYESSIGWNVINWQKSSWNDKKPKTRNIKVDEKNYIEAINLLISNGLVNVEVVKYDE